MTQRTIALRIATIVCALPPQLDGIGDYTAHLSLELAKTARVKIISGVDQNPAPIPGVEIEQAFSPSKPKSVCGITRHVQADCPDWVILQFNQFSFGRWGLNPYLPRTMQSLKRRLPDTRFAVMFHEDFVPPSNWKFRIMRLWQRRQFIALGRTADLVLFSIDPWVQKYRSWFPGKPVVHLPVGSNIPRTSITRGQARARLGIPNGVCVLGVFGTAHASRQLGVVRQAAVAARQAGHNVLILYTGPHPEAVRQTMKGITLIAEGPLEGEEVSRRFAATDVYLAPFVDGASTRRTSLITGLQHGVATVSTCGLLTDVLLKKQDGRALLLADVDAPQEFNAHVLRLAEDAALRQRIGSVGRELYEQEFTWESIGARLLSLLSK
jgi:glycosyltransferase involved in cell wall biosynthesis